MNTFFFIKNTIKSVASPFKLAFASLVKARVAICAHAQQEVYVVAIRRIRKIYNMKEGSVKSMDLDCSRSHLSSICTGNCQRTSSSSRMVCLLKASVRRLDNGYWQVQVANDEHNMSPSPTRFPIRKKAVRHDKIGIQSCI